MRLEKISIELAYMLRHSRDPVYVCLDDGWASVDDIIEALRRKYPQMDRRLLDEIVSSDAKGRYSYDATGTKIRANQGHSIPGVRIQMSAPEPPEFLYHGTATRFLPAILKEGLKPMSRQFVHISPDFETAVKVGKRHGNPVVLVIRAADLVSDGYRLLLSANGVWQAEEVPPEYFTVEYTN